MSSAAYQFQQDAASGLFVPSVRDESRNLHRVIAAPLPGPQMSFMQDDSSEIACVGNRGGGKTEILCLKLLSGIGRGWGSNYSCVLLRSSLREMTDLIQMIEDLGRPVWGRSMSYNKLNHEFTWKSGERIELGYLIVESAFQLFRGRQFAVVAVEEATLQADPSAYTMMFSCLRGPLSESAGFKRQLICSFNPGGPTHNFFVHRFNLSGIPKGTCGPQIVDANGETRRAHFCNFYDNAVLRRTSPQYLSTLMTSTEGDEILRRSWVLGDFSIVAGGAMDAIFLRHADTIFIDDFEIPATWRTFASFDLGSTRPWAWLAFAESDGTDFQYKNGRVGRSLPGDLFLVGEQYGWDGSTPDKGDHASIAEITARIQNYKIQRGWRFQDVQNPKRWHDMFKRNYSDDAIGQEMNGYSAQEEFKNPVILNGISHPGIPFELVSKPPGSRETGFALVRERLLNTAPRAESKIREGKGLFIVRDHCPQTVRTLPVLSRNPKKPDDVDPACESHIYDAIRYALAADRAPKFSTRRRWIA
jgi:hypothetical protein